MSIASPPESRVYTADDLLNMPEDWRFELIRGELIPMPPPPGGEHGALTNDLSGLATAFALQNNLGQGFAAETGFLISTDPDSVIAPDWAFITRERLPERVGRKHMPVVPDLVLETRSPNDSRREISLKVQLWLLVGVRIVWELDPRGRTLTVHRAGATPNVLKPEDTLTGEDVLPGLEIPLSLIFRIHKS